MRRIVLLLALVYIAGAAQAQVVFGPGDTVKLPLDLMDSINNPAAVDSAADSVLVRVIKNMAANASGADTCYLHRGLMDASTNTLLHTTGNATTTLGFGSVPKRVQTFSFFATAYALTNSATASGTYTIEVWTYDHSLGLITTRKIPFNYIYFGSSTGTYAMWVDSVGSMARWAMKTIAPDSTSAGYLKVDIYSVAATTQTARDLGAQLDSATSKVGVGDGAIGAAEIATDAVGSAELADAAAREIAEHILKDTTKRIGVKGGLGDSVLVPSATLAAGQVTKIKDTVNIATNLVAAKDSAGLSARKDSSGLAYRSEPDSITQKIARIILGDTTKRVFSGMLNDTTKRIKFSNDSVVAIDPVRTVAATVAGDVGGIAGVTFPSTVPSIKQIRDTLVKSTDTGRVRVDAQGYLFAGNVMLDTTKRVPLKGGAGTDSLRSASFSVSVDTASVARSVWDNDIVTQINRTVTATATVDTAAVARSVWDNDIVAQSGRTVTATATVDTAAVARSVWDNDVVARANRTIDEVDTVVLACINGDTVANAGDFLKTALDYRNTIKDIFGVANSNSTWMTDTVMNQLVRQAVVKVNPIMRGVKFKDTVVTSWQRSDYNLDSMIGVVAVSWQREDTVRPITYAPLETWGALQHQSTWGQADPYLSRPSVYDVTDNQIMFFPPPTESDTVELVGFRKVYGIVTTSDFSAIPQAYRIPVLYYAAYLVAQSKQHPSTDRLLSEYNKAVSDILTALNRRVNVQK